MAQWLPKLVEYALDVDDQTIKFSDGTPVKELEEVKYLGCRLNENNDIKMELNRRLGETNAIWKQLNNFWYNISDINRISDISLEPISRKH